MKNFKAILLLVFLTIIFGCKKTNDERFITYDEMKEITANSPEIISLFKINDELKSLEEERIFNNLTKRRQITSSSYNNEQSKLIDFKKLKTREDLRLALLEINPEKGELILEKLENQQKLIIKFAEDNPSFKNFTDNQRTEFITSAFEKYQNNSVGLTLSKFKNFNNIKTFDCMGQFNYAYNGCTTSFNIEYFAILGGVALSAIGGPATFAMASAGGVILMAAAYYEWENCINTAVNAMSVC